MSPLKKVSSGDPFEPTADTWNSFVTAAQYVQQRQINITSSVRGRDTKPGIVLVRNKSGEDCFQFAALGIDDVIIKPGGAGEQEFRNRTLTFDCKKLGDIDQAKRHEMRFVILQEPIAQDKCGRAMISGTTPVVLDVKDEKHEYAWPLADNSALLESAPVGVCRILWKQSGTGEKWAVVQFPSGDFPRVVIKNASGSTIQDGDACMVTSVGDKPWVLQVNQPDADNLLHVIPYNGPDLASGESAVMNLGEVMRFSVADSDLSPGDFVGTKPGSWQLHKNRFGFLILAVEPTGGFAYVRYSGITPVLKAVSDESGGTISVKHVDSGGATAGDAFDLDVIPEDQ